LFHEPVRGKNDVERSKLPRPSAGQKPKSQVFQTRRRAGGGGIAVEQM
jgi:hypothetical protein